MTKSRKSTLAHVLSRTPVADRTELVDLYEQSLATISRLADLLAGLPAESSKEDTAIRRERNLLAEAYATIEQTRFHTAILDETSPDEEPEDPMHDLNEARYRTIEGLQAVGWTYKFTDKFGNPWYVRCDSCDRIEFCQVKCDGMPYVTDDLNEAQR